MSYRKSLITSFNVLALNCVLHSLEIERSLKSIINCNICLFIIFSRIFPLRSYRIRDDLFASVVFRFGYVNSLDVITPFHVLHRWKHLKHIVYSIHVMCVLCFRIKIKKEKTENAKGRETVVHKLLMYKHVLSLHRVIKTVLLMSMLKY